MYVVANQDSFKTRRPKLRASCGNCFLAKVKCSKARPICSRCLVSGADCNYTPSSQASKPKSDGGKASQSSISRDVPIPEDSNTLTTASTSQSMNIDGEHSISYELGTDWSTTPGSLDGRMSRRSVSSTLMPMIGDDSTSEAESSGAHPDLFDLYFSWTNTPRTDITSPHIDNILLPRSKSLSDTLVPQSLGPWSDRRGYTNFSSSVPGLGPAPNLSMSNSMAKSSTCSCFNTSLKVLQALHNSDVITSASTFDVILTVNQKAVQGCAMMLNCPICISKSGSSHTTMLLGTIIGKIISIYQDASKNYFGVTPGPSSQIQPLPLTLGTYRVASQDERWLEIEIVLRELEKLKELFDKFQKVAKASKSEEDAGMRSTVTNYLCQSLQLTFEVLEKQRDISCG